jgi:hypothetical protein
VSERSPNSSLSCFYNRGRKVPSFILFKSCVCSGNKICKFNKILDLLDFNIYFVLK